MRFVSSKRLNRLVLAITIVGAAHMGEQLMTSIEEFYMLRDGLGGWYALFPAEYADRASVLLITLIFTAISLIVYALMCGGYAVLFVAGFFGLLGIGEAHHLIEAVLSGGYDPGLITSFAYVGVGALILLEVVRELRAPRRAGGTAVNAA